MHGAMKRSMVVLGVLALGLVVALHAAAGPPGGAYKVTPLVSDIPGNGLTDSGPVRAGALPRSDRAPGWVADNGPDPTMRKSTVYTRGGTKILSATAPGGPPGPVFPGLDGTFMIGTDAAPT